MKTIEVEGKSVTMAVEKGLAELGLRRDQVEVEVLQEPNPGFLGLGAKLARVKLTEKAWEEEGARPRSSSGGQRPIIEKSAYAPSGRPAPRPAPRPRREDSHSRSEGRSYGRGGGGGDRGDRGERGGRDRGSNSEAAAYRLVKSPQPTPPPDPAKACEAAKAWLEELFKAMEISAENFRTEWDQAQLRVRVEFDTKDGETLLGNEGKTIESLQFLTTLIVSRRLQTPVAIQVETDGYWVAREESILTQVHQAIEEVKRTGKVVRLPPMDASIRRMVHRSLSESPDVDTVSEGEGSWRKIVLRPKSRR